LEGVNYAAKIAKAESAIDWSQPAPAIERRMRAFDPTPGSTGLLGGELVKLWRAQVLAERNGVPGEILEASTDGLVVACGAGALRLTELQRAGGRRVPAAAFLAGCSAAVPGARFEMSARLA
jgi:methionyl-tRNA formyltransferase